MKAANQNLLTLIIKLDHLNKAGQILNTMQSCILIHFGKLMTGEPGKNSSDPDNNNSDNIKRRIEDMLIGEGAKNFQNLETQISQFCPFEAIGMVRQEIKHSNFLGFILDPNRPHPFQDHFLIQFIQLIMSEANDGQIDLEPLDLHCSDINGVIVFRERANIDILIEIPSLSSFNTTNKLVIAIELKIDAKEDPKQLPKYLNYVRGKYPAPVWKHAFVFLTKDELSPSDHSKAEWIPVGLKQLIDCFDQEFQAKAFEGEAAKLYQSYSKMIRRHLVSDSPLSELAKNIWARHKEALEFLYEHRPNLEGEVMEQLCDNPQMLCNLLNEHSQFSVSNDTSSKRIIRYSVNNWSALPGFVGSSKEWVNSGSLLVIELYAWGNRFRCSIVMGLGNETLRQAIYEACTSDPDIKISRNTKKIPAYKHMTSKDVMDTEKFAELEAAQEEASEIAKQVINETTRFLLDTLPKYDKVLRKVLR